MKKKVIIIFLFVFFFRCVFSFHFVVNDRVYNIHNGDVKTEKKFPNELFRLFFAIPMKIKETS